MSVLERVKEIVVEQLGVDLKYQQAFVDAQCRSLDIVEL